LRSRSRARSLAPYLLIAVVSALPRLAVLVHERSAITSAFVEKSDRFATTFVASGTFGLIPGVPSAYTQPLYGWFLIPLYWIVGRSWATIGLAQIAVAVATAIVVYLIARRLVSQWIAVAAALVSTLNPYLVWHDVHVNREILDQLLAALLVLTTLVAAQRRSWAWTVAVGAVLGLAILGNVRLAALPLLVGAYLLWQRVPPLSIAAMLAAAVIVLAPWVIRNKVQLGCYAITTDARALWKANNLQTYSLLSHGFWIDDVRPIPGAPPTPEAAADHYEQTGEIIPIDECAQMSFYRRRVIEFWKQHPGAKAKLAAQAVKMEWQPSVVQTSATNGETSSLGTVRRLVQPLYTVPLYLLAIVGLFFAPLEFSVLAVALLAYQTLAAIIFVGSTRYRVPWDFLVALLAAAAADGLLRRFRAPERRTAGRPAETAAPH
jgi:4-amino-4-deoxy-L-arabinose transferase-like glycosyltransferase